MPNKKVLECPVTNCEEDFTSHNSLRYHIIEFHGLKLKEENFMFENPIGGLPSCGRPRPLNLF